MVEAKDLTFSYIAGENILKDISFTVEQGEIIGVLGENGVGKSTLLKLLCGILTPRSGSISIDGAPVQAHNGEIAFISEAGSFLKELTPMAYGRFLQDFYPNFDMAYYERLLRFFKLEEKPIKRMSKGQKAKAEVAAGMAKRTPYIVMDEPFVGKDIFTRQDFMQALAGSLTGEETIWITTHEIAEIESFIDRAWILKDGGIAADISMDELHQSGRSLVDLMKEVTGYREGAFARGL